MANLAVFDIDGTIMHSAGHDVSLFRNAHVIHIGEDSVAAHWGDFTHMTDHAINGEFFDRLHGRAPSEDEQHNIQQTFIGMIKDSHQTNPERFKPVKGANTALQNLLDHPDWHICFASGGWGLSSTYKLQTMGIDATAHPAAFGDGHNDRISLVTSAIDAARDQHDIDRYDHIVSIGDAEWDVVTARDLDLGFIGIASWQHPDILFDAGAAHVIDHYEDYDEFEELLHRAEVPL